MGHAACFRRAGHGTLGWWAKWFPASALAWRLAFVAVVAVLLARWQIEYHQFDDSPITGGVTELMRQTSRTAFLGEWISWQVRVPLLFAYGCTIYAAGWLAFRLAACSVSALRSLIARRSKE